MPNIQLRIKPSLYLTTMFGAMSMLAVFCMLTMPWPWPWRALSCLILAGITGYTILQHGLRRLSHAVVALHIQLDNSVELIFKDGHGEDVRIMPTSVVTPILTLVHCRLRGLPWYRCPTLSLLIAADAVEPDAYRRLRIYLRWTMLPP